MARYELVVNTRMTVTIAARSLQAAKHKAEDIMMWRFVGYIEDAESISADGEKEELEVDYLVRPE